MKQLSLTCAGVLFLFLITSCESQQNKLVKEISKSEKEMFKDSSMVPDPAKAQKIIEMYTDYVAKFPDDSLSSGFLFKAGDISSKINQPAKAIEYFNQIIHKYPDSKSAPLALFLQGFIYENQIGDPMKAKPYYEEFIKKYPDHPFAGDASFSLEHLGQSPEQLIKMFENKTDSVSTKDSTATS